LSPSAGPVTQSRSEAVQVSSRACPGRVSPLLRTGDSASTSRRVRPIDHSAGPDSLEWLRHGRVVGMRISIPGARISVLVPELWHFIDNDPKRRRQRDRASLPRRSREQCHGPQTKKLTLPQPWQAIIPTRKFRFCNRIPEVEGPSIGSSGPVFVGPKRQPRISRVASPIVTDM